MNDVFFASLGLSEDLLKGLETSGFKTATPVQAEAIPALIAGHDVVAQAATGTGKTAAFGLPMLQRVLDSPRTDNPTALVLTPTRELAMQVAEAIREFGKPIGARVVAVYGGQPIQNQLRDMKRGVDIVVATPGRAVDHIKRNSLILDDIKIVGLDEADEMLDMGFADELETVLSQTPKDRQTVLFSATMPSRLRSIANRYQRDAVSIRIADAPREAGAELQVTQTVYMVSRHNKAAALGRVLDMESPTAAIVFCKSRDQVDELTEQMKHNGYRAEALHGGMDQQQRDRVMNRLRNKSADLLLATDVAARGLDIDHLTHVINYDVPAQAESYVHRIGRVGRAGRNGVAITFAEPRDERQLKNIERTTKRQMEIAKLPSGKDLFYKRREQTKATVKEAIIAGDFDNYEDIVTSLADEFDVRKLALAAVKMIHEAAAGGASYDDIPDVTDRGQRDRGPRNDRGGERFDRGDRGPRSDRGGERGPKRSYNDGAMDKIYIGSGRDAGVRPQDIVGAIANETSLSGKQIGSIDIAPKFTIVDVPSGSGNEVINALKQTTIKGHKVSVRFDKGSSSSSDRGSDRGDRGGYDKKNNWRK